MRKIIKGILYIVLVMMIVGCATPMKRPTIVIEGAKKQALMDFFSSISGIDGWKEVERKSNEITLYKKGVSAEYAIVAIFTEVNGKTIVELRLYSTGGEQRELREKYDDLQKVLDHLKTYSYLFVE